MFVDRVDAGRQLARRLEHLDPHDLVVLGLPRGGVVVAAEVARGLGAPLDVIVVWKLGLPSCPELGMGALGEGGARVLNPEVLREARLGASELAVIEAAGRSQVVRRAARLRGALPPLTLHGQTAVIVDDGVATGSTACAACQVARARGAAKVVLAVPVGATQSLRALADVVDDVVCLRSDDSMLSVGSWYQNFNQVSDQEVLELLHRARNPWVDAEVTVAAAGVDLPGRLTVPDNAMGIVVFAHGSGSSRHSPRNQYVAMLLNRAGLGTLLLDLLTGDEEWHRRTFDIELLARRLSAAVDWVRHQPEGKAARIGLFGASTGAAAALWVAAEPGADVSAVVSRGGRPDLAGARVPLVSAPTLLVVGERDTAVLALNEAARQRMRCPNRLAVVPGASHLFEEPGALSAVAVLARDWFLEHVHGRTSGSG